jgi:uncharacterized protein (TIGR02646 family)
MRYIDKSNRNIDFDDFVNEIRQRLKKWENLKNKRNKAKVKGSDIQFALFQHLWQQQKGLCIYCQQGISEKLEPYQTAEEIIAQLEHICPQSHCEDKIFEQDNIAVSCEGFNLSEPAPTENRRNFCGHYKDNITKGNVYNTNMFLNPTIESEIENYFYYDSSGAVFPNPVLNEAEQEKAAYMIKILGLDNPMLNDMRRTQYDIFIQINDINELQKLLNEQNVLFSPFHSMLKIKFL